MFPILTVVAGIEGQSHFFLLGSTEDPSSLFSSAVF